MPEVDALRDGLCELGYVAGKNIALEFHWADGGVGKLPQIAADFVRGRVAIILAPALTSFEPVRQASQTIPILFAQHADQAFFPYGQ